MGSRQRHAICFKGRRRRHGRPCGVERLEARLVLDGSLPQINELSAGTVDILADAEGEYVDWLEIHNPTDRMLSLDGWYLTDDEQVLAKWQFPDVAIAPSGYLVVFASGKDRAEAGEELHTNFQLDRNGEYLALVQPDGNTVAHEYSPEFPKQNDGFTFGQVTNKTELVGIGADVQYHVPDSNDAGLGTSWTAIEFHDSAWHGAQASSPVLITEIGTYNPDFVEIQNVSDQSVDTSGWVVVANDGTNGEINDAYATRWMLPDGIVAGEVLYRSDESDDPVEGATYWGHDIYWRTRGSGWVMLVDESGNLADFVVWGYSPEEIATLSVSVGGSVVDVAEQWSGPSIVAAGNSRNSYQRLGHADRNNAADWARSLPPSPAEANPALLTPLDLTPGAGIGFSAAPAGFGLTRYTANVPVDSILGAEAVILDPATWSSTAMATATAINFADGDEEGHFNRSDPFPDVAGGGGGGDFVVEATTLIVIPEPGPWTFGVHTAGGFSLALNGADQTLFAAREATAAPEDALAVFEVPAAGTYDLRLVHFDQPGENALELFAAPGNRDEFDADVFFLVGDTEDGGLAAAGVAGSIATDIRAEMLDHNASVWARVSFEAPAMEAADSLRLRMKSSDGFVAYLNGQEIARRYAPDNVQWGSASTQRGPNQWLFWEEIDVSASLGALIEGTNVLAIHGLNSSATDGEFLILPELIVGSSQDSERFFDQPTPGGPNAQGYLGFVADTKFSADRGFYDAAFQVRITTETSGATIRYTLDGSKPTETHGAVYDGPINVTTTTTVRAAAFRHDDYPTNVDTQTYIFLDDVVRQPARPPGYPTTWQPGYPADYEMDPQVVDNPLYSPVIREGLLSIPTMSIVMDVDDVFGQPNGIYSNSVSAGPSWEREMSLEFLDSDDPQRQFQLNSAVRMHGKGSRFPNRTRKHNFRAIFKEPFGPTKLDFPLFEGSPVERFDTLVLRAGYNYSWNHNSSTQRIRAQYLRDTFARETHLAMGQPTVRGDYVHLYINGLYWGVYQTNERPDASFQAQHLGGDKSEYDALNGNKVVDGDLQVYQDVMRLAGEDLSVESNYGAVLELVDPASLIDYMILQMYSGTTDWPVSEGQLTNWWMGRKRVDGDEGRFRFYTWDAEHTQYSVSVDRFGVSDAGTPPYLFTRLRANPDFRRMVGDRVHYHMFHGGALTIDANVDRYQELADKIEWALVGESARWADQKSEQANRPHTVQNEWVRERNWMLETYFPQRGGVVLQQFKRYGLYPSVSAPIFRVDGVYQHGGPIASDSPLTMPSAAGEVYYTLDDSDPRAADGSVSPTAFRFDGTEVLLSQSAMVQARALSGGQWSALNGAQFLVGVPASAENLVIAEINYNPYDPTEAELAIDSQFGAQDFEFIELANTSPFVVDLSGVTFVDGIEFDFGEATVQELPPGGPVVVVSNGAAFEARYGGDLPVAGEYTGQLRNGGENLRLEDVLGEPIADFAFDDSGAWPGRADGKGAALELRDLSVVPTDSPLRSAFLEDPSNWNSSVRYGGTPAAAAEGDVGVVVNEVFTRSDPPEIDWIELFNATATAIDVGGWYLSDDGSTYQKYRIPVDDAARTTIPPGGHLVFDERDFNPTGGAAETDFALNGIDGDDVWLMKADATGMLTHFADHADFGPTPLGRSLGRWPNGQGDLTAMLVDTAGRGNVGPYVSPVFISEIHYHPTGGANQDDLEFVEIYNATSDPVDIGNWQIRSGIDYSFAPETMLPAESALVVVRFDAADATSLAAFRDAYDLDASVVIVGGYGGRLSDLGETIRLLRPGIPPEGQEGLVFHVVEDEVGYGVAEPWPEGAGGQGDSLQRQGLNRWGNNPESWADAAPTPGAAPIPAAATVAGRHVFYNGSVFDGGDPAVDARDDEALAPDKVALLPGETATFANYTSYSRGLNGIIVDLSGLPPNALPASDGFQFRVGNSNNPQQWEIAPAPSAVLLRPGAGEGGSDRVTLTWPDGAIRGQWLEVTVLPTADTGLIEPDVFYFGNAVGEAGNSDTDAKVNVVDMLLARNNPRTFLNPAPIDFDYDYNRDGRVNATDMLLARNNPTNFLTALRLIDVPPIGSNVGEIPPPAAAEARMPIPLAAMVAVPAVESESADQDLSWLSEMAPSALLGDSSLGDRPQRDAVDALRMDDWR